VFHVFAALAEFIRELIVAGTPEGLTAARERGRTGGRPIVATPEIIAAARDLRSWRAARPPRGQARVHGPGTYPTRHGH
jgi:DNA invertase Pin-like site-specific DNA recombinase